jgi:hypothetical protein
VNQLLLHPFVEIYPRPPALSSKTIDNVVSDNRRFLVDFDGEGIVDAIFGADRWVGLPDFQSQFG